MSEPRGSRKQGSNRIYTWRDQSYWSVTTIIGGALRRFALEKWNARTVAEAAVINRAVIAAFLNQCTTPDACNAAKANEDRCDHCAAAIGWLKDAPFRGSGRKAELGTTMHAAIEAYTLGRPMPPWPIAIGGRMRQFERFLADWAPTYELAEAVVYNRTQQYAGQLDAGLTLPLERITPLQASLLGWPTDRDPRLALDYKSSERGIYPEVALQLAAYRGAEFVGLIDGSEQPMPAFDGGVALQLTDDTYNLIPVQSGPDVFEAFLYAREVFRFSEVTARTVLYPALAPSPPKALEVTV